jgi:hypothetical protein
MRKCSAGVNVLVVERGNGHYLAEEDSKPLVPAQQQPLLV